MRSGVHVTKVIAASVPMHYNRLLPFWQGLTRSFRGIHCKLKLGPSQPLCFGKHGCQGFLLPRFKPFIKVLLPFVKTSVLLSRFFFLLSRCSCLLSRLLSFCQGFFPFVKVLLPFVKAAVLLSRFFYLLSRLYTSSFLFDKGSFVLSQTQQYNKYFVNL